MQQAWLEAARSCSLPPQAAEALSKLMPESEPVLPCRNVDQWLKTVKTPGSSLQLAGAALVRKSALQEQLEAARHQNTGDRHLYAEDAQEIKVQV